MEEKVRESKRDVEILKRKREREIEIIREISTATHNWKEFSKKYKNRDFQAEGP